MIYQREIQDVTFVPENCDMKCPKQLIYLKELHFFVRALNKFDKSPGEEIFGVGKKSIKKLTDYFFMILNLGNASFGN